MKDGKLITELERTDFATDESAYIIEMADGTGSKHIEHKNLVKSIRPIFEESKSSIDAETALENIKSNSPLPDLIKNIKYFCKGAITLGKVLTTKEEISANTNADNVVGALAAKAMMADYNNKISTINGKIFNDLPTTSWGGVIANEDVVSNSSIQYQKYGNVCNLYFTGSISTTDTWTDYKLASGLPPAKYGYNPMGILQQQDTQKAYVVYTNQNGELYIRTENDPPNGWMRGSITYICN